LRLQAPVYACDLHLHLYVLQLCCHALRLPVQLRLQHWRRL